MPLFAFQRYYIPLYAIDVTAHTRELPRYDFRRYLAAEQLPAEGAKSLDVLANPAAWLTTSSEPLAAKTEYS